MLIRRTVVTPWDPTRVFGYLADFTNTEEWDDGTVRTTLISGDGGVGSEYRNVSKFLGRETELTYRVLDLQEPARIELRGENGGVVAHDTMLISEVAGGGSRVTYEADFTLKGWVRLMAPLMAPAFRRLGDRSAQRLSRALAD